MSVLDGVVGSAVGGLMGIAGSALEYNYSKKLAEQQNQYNLDMWKMQADYNSPQAQMERFKAAGLNPNLIYGQGNNGNMSQSPQMVTPDAPHLSKEMQELGKAFNIEAIKTMVANRKKAENEARISQLSVFDREDERDALARLANLYSYDPVTGRWKYVPGGVDVDKDNPRGHGVGNNFIGGALLSKYIAENDPIMHLRALHRSYLEPQILMSNFDANNYKYRYWIENGSKIAGAAGSLINSLWPKLRFSRERGSLPTPRAKTTYIY